MQELDVVEDVRLGGGCEQVGLSGDGHLGFDEEEIPPGGTIDFTLLGTAVSGVTIGHLFGDAQCGEHYVVGQGVGFSAGGLPKSADEVAGEGDTFLPDLELAKRSCHGVKMAADKPGSRTERTWIVS
jgi:hypothetical protein